MGLLVTSGYHIVQNSVYDYIIATDEGTGRGDVDSDQEGESEDKAKAEPEGCERLEVLGTKTGRNRRADG